VGSAGSTGSGSAGSGSAGSAVGGADHARAAEVTDLAHQMAAQCLAAETPLHCVAALFDEAWARLGKDVDAAIVAPRLTGYRPDPDAASVALASKVDVGLLTPDCLGEVYQRLLGAEVRHDAGVHYTSPWLAEGLVSAAVSQWEPPPELRVLDPTVGGGVFLLAAARWMLAAGIDGGDRSQIVSRLTGRDLDPGAVAVAEAALGLWQAEDDGVWQPGSAVASGPDLAIGDAVVDELPTADLIVGNPPFLNQLGARTARSADHRAVARERFGVTVGPYGDTAALILLAAVNALSDKGRLCLVQPLSILASRDVGGIRERLGSRLVGMWTTGEPVFDAAVHVCAPVVAGEHLAGKHAGALQRWFGPTVGEELPAPQPATGSWGATVSDLFGVPEVQPVDASSRTVADLASATAGFRDQFYGFVPFVTELGDGTEADGWARLLTTGMIDPLHNRWGKHEFRFAKKLWTRPGVDLQALAAGDPSLSSWAAQRRVPKVLVATQTRVIEVVVDSAGEMIPATPVISVEPVLSNAGTGDHSAVVWRLAAVLSAPAMTARAMSQHFGAARSLSALKLAASQVQDLPLPGDQAAWDRGAALARTAHEAGSVGDAAGWRAAMMGLGEEMNHAYGEPGRVFDWWQERLPGFR